mmetsp:Transcript_14850/g.34906  ORF Transcript_14850/g.34906 Transcript_14850/m.34906 type:complete len:215 (-) Transcript_14850:1017-1661(-)
MTVLAFSFDASASAASCSGSSFDSSDSPCSSAQKPSVAARTGRKSVSWMTASTATDTAARTANDMTAGMPVHDPIINAADCAVAAEMTEGPTRSSASPARTAGSSRQHSQTGLGSLTALSSSKLTRRSRGSSAHGGERDASKPQTRMKTLSTPMASTMKGMTSLMISVALTPASEQTAAAMSSESPTMKTPVSDSSSRSATGRGLPPPPMLHVT